MPICEKPLLPGVEFRRLRSTIAQQAKNMCPSCIPALPFLAGTVSSGGLSFVLICGLRALLAKLRGSVGLHLNQKEKRA
jgi:hypothetical protein